MTTTLPPLVGLIGKKRVGKDTFASVLVEEFGFARVAFADPLKEMALVLNPIIQRDPVPGGDRPIRLRWAVETVGWEAVKDEHPEARRVLQQLGDGVRQFAPEFWVRAAMSQVATTRNGHPYGRRDEPDVWYGPHPDPRPVVITDVRYPNEADAIREAGGTLVRIVRPGVDDGDTHASETALDGYTVPHTIWNEWDRVEDFRADSREHWVQHIQPYL